jgi:hypothetical protein
LAHRLHAPYPPSAALPSFIYWPLTTPFLLAAGFIVIAVAAFLLLDVFS